jgi:microcystin-dependent protein
MKSVFISVLLSLLFFISANAQTAQKGFSFQGYARNAEGAALGSQTVTVKFSLYPKDQAVEYEETHVLTTDQFGVFHAVIGAKTPASFGKLLFDTKNYWLKVEVKAGSSDYVEISNTELLSVPYAKSADNGVPPGTILPFAGPKSRIPAGYLACDGGSYNNADYPNLYNTIGNAWGGSGAQFNVPDLRGMFLRGVSETTARDEDRSTRTASNVGGNTGNTVGSVQSEDFRNHNHTGSTSTNGNHTHTWNYGNERDDSGEGGSADEFTKAGGSSNPMSYAGDHSHTFTTNGTGGNETRPDNAYVFYIIKY